MITKSGGNAFSGSFRDTLNNDNWRTLTPFEDTQIADRSGAQGAARRQDGADATSTRFGGPILKDHLWFFTAGRLQTQESGRSLVITNMPYTFTDETRRYEGKGTFSINPNHTFQGAYTKIIDNQTNDTFNTVGVDGRPTASTTGSCRRISSTASYNGVLCRNFFVEGRVLARATSASSARARRRPT